MLVSRCRGGSLSRFWLVMSVVLVAGFVMACGEDDLERGGPAGVAPVTTPTFPAAPLSSASALIALESASGSELWSVPLAHEWTQTVFLAGDTVYAYASQEGTLASIDAGTHTQRWRFAAEGAGHLPAPNADTIFALKGRELVAIDAVTGAERWSAPELKPLDANDDAVVALDREGGLAALDAQTGDALWRVKTNVSYGMLAGNAIYLSVWGIRGAEDSVRVFDSTTGAELWAAEFSSPWIGGVADGNVYVFVEDVSAPDGASQLVALDAVSGAERWRIAGNDVVWLGRQAHAATGNGMLFTFLDEGRLAALDAETGEIRWEAEVPQADVVFSDGLVVLAEAYDEHPRDEMREPRMRVQALDAMSGEQRWAREIDDYGGLPGGGYTSIVADVDRVYIVKP